MKTEHARPRPSPRPPKPPTHQVSAWPGVLLIGVVLVLVVWWTWKAWHWGRELHYSWAYRDMVINTMCEQVKREHLKDPGVCGE